MQFLPAVVVGNLIRAAVAALVAVAPGCMDAGTLGETYQTGGNTTETPVNDNGSCSGCPILRGVWTPSTWAGTLVFYGPKYDIANEVTLLEGDFNTAIPDKFTPFPEETIVYENHMDIALDLNVDQALPTARNYVGCTVHVRNVGDAPDRRRVVCGSAELELALRIEFD